MSRRLPAALLSLALAAPPALASAGASDTALRFVQAEAAASLGPQGLRSEVSVGRIQESRTAQCRRSEAFLLPGSRMWGRSVIGLRCLEGDDWSLTVPINVRVFGPALVAARPLAARTPLDPTAVTAAEIELTRHTQSVLASTDELEARVLVRSIAAGQPIPHSAVRAPQVLKAGDPVRIQGAGRGFSVTLSGQALGAAEDGQAVRVRTEAGRVLSGTARAGGVVEVAL